MYEKIKNTLYPFVVGKKKKLHKTVLFKIRKIKKK